MKRFTLLMTALGFLAGCGAPAHVPLDNGTTGEPVYPRSAISNPAILRVAGLIRELALRERTADGAELFSSCEILPPARSVLPYGVGQYEQQLRLPVILTTSPAWEKMPAESRRIALAGFREVAERSTANVPELKGPTITVVNSKGWQIAWLNGVAHDGRMFLGDE